MFERFGFRNVTAHVQRKERERAADHERNAPAPTLDLRGREQHVLHQQHQRERDQLPR
jgi:hypothetical protein